MSPNPLATPQLSNTFPSTIDHQQQDEQQPSQLTSASSSNPVLSNNHPPHDDQPTFVIRPPSPSPQFPTHGQSSASFQLSSTPLSPHLQQPSTSQATPSTTSSNTSKKSVRFASTTSEIAFNPSKSTLQTTHPNASYAWHSVPEIVKPMIDHSSPQITATILPSQLSSVSPRPNQMRACIDSAASADIIPDATYFDTITYYDQTDPSTPSVQLGDESTNIPIMGYGIASYSIQGKTIRKRALFVPGLNTTALISVKQHMQNAGCYFHAEAQNTVLAFPTFLIAPRVAKEIDVYLHHTVLLLIQDQDVRGRHLQAWSVLPLHSP
jgi:hypothetical protein